MNCPDCGVPDGGSDRNGRRIPNHICLVDHFSDGMPVIAEPTAEQVAWKKKFNAECRCIVARLYEDMAAQQAKEIADAEAEQRRQEKMREDHRRFMRQRELERRQPDMELKNLNLEFGVKE